MLPTSPRPGYVSQRDAVTSLPAFVSLHNLDELHARSY